MTVPKPPNASQALAKLLGGGGPTRPTHLGIAAVATILLTIALLAVICAPLLRLRTTTATTDEVKPEEVPVSSDKFEQSISTFIAQVEGRSLFYKPGPPRPKVETAKSNSPKATRYGGPSIVAMVNNAVWFSDGQHLEAGQSGKGGTLKVVSLNAPWTARIAWEGGEFDVGFFDRSPLLMSAADSLKPAGSKGEDTRPPVPLSHVSPPKVTATPQGRPPDAAPATSTAVEMIVAEPEHTPLPEVVAPASPPPTTPPITTSDPSPNTQPIAPAPSPNPPAEPEKQKI